MLANLQSALTTYAELADLIVRSRRRGVGGLRSCLVAQQRERNRPTSTRNRRPEDGLVGRYDQSLLNQFTAANNAVVTGLQTGANISSAQDTRDSIVTQLAQQLGVSTTVAANGSESIYTDSGVTLFQDTPRTVSFTATPTLVDGSNGGAVTVGGVPITGAIRRCPFIRARSPAMPRYGIRSRPNIRPSSTRSQAASSTPSPKATSRRPPHCPRCQACLRRAGATTLPSMSATTGLAAAIEVNPNVDHRRGQPESAAGWWDLRPGNPAYTYNTTGAASYTGRIQELVSEISATQSFDPSAGLDPSSSLTDYANASVSWLQAQNQQASDASSYQSAVASQAAFGVVERHWRQSGR